MQVLFFIHANNKKPVFTRKKFLKNFFNHKNKQKTFSSNIISIKFFELFLKIIKICF